MGFPILVIIVAITIVQALALSTLVGSVMSDFNMLAFLLLLTVDCLVAILVILGEMGMVYQTSNSWVKKMQLKINTRRIPLRDRKWEGRFYKSCSALRIMIGSRNFVDQLTPLNSLQFSMTLTANLLLLSLNERLDQS